MPKKYYTPEQIVTKLKLIEVLLSQGKQILLACKEAGILDKSYYHWRKELGGLKLTQAKKFNEPERENA